tara:strand:+ start:33148 stop:33477 length:330 start_codon:yes stop_codon:yes gene_type:complete
MTAPFDFLLAIAAMPQSNGQASDEMLRDAYPELSFFFDEVSDLRDRLAVEEAEETERDLQLDVERCIMVMADCRDLIDVVRKMDGAAKVEKMLADISHKLDTKVNDHEN